ncbi:MAG: hypothetical protein AAFR81_22545 [Chloroflexota bacterium]
MAKKRKKSRMQKRKASEHQIPMETSWGKKLAEAADDINMIVLDSEGVTNENIDIAISALAKIALDCFVKGDTYGMTIFGDEETGERLGYVAGALKLEN